MSAYRFVDPNPVIFNLLGLAAAPNGSLTFYEKGTTDDKDTWSDQALTVENENPVELDSAGRAETEIWLDGEYTVVAKAQDGSTIWTRDVVPEIAPGLAIPSLAGNTGFYLSNDGTSLIWVTRQDLPDPSGSAGYQVVVNSGGTGYILQAIAEPPEPPEPEIVITGNGATGSFQAGTSASTTKYYRQWGNDSAPANAGAKTTSKAVVFPVAFVDAPRVFIEMNGAGFTNAGSYPGKGISALSSTGFTVRFDSQTGEANSDMNISSAVPFSWTAEGTRLVVP